MEKVDKDKMGEDKVDKVDKVNKVDKLVRKVSWKRLTRTRWTRKR